MVMVQRPAKKWGNSLGIVIPAEITKKMKLKEGQIIEADIKPKKSFDAFGLFKGAKKFKREKEAHRNFW